MRIEGRYEVIQIKIEETMKKWQMCPRAHLGNKKNRFNEVLGESIQDTSQQHRQVQLPQSTPS